MTMLAFAVLFVPGVEAASCRGYPQGVRAVLKKQVEALRALERETADRLKGLDTRPFDYLLSRARATAQVIADKDALVAEESLSRCREAVPPVRRVCAEAAQALVSLIETLETGAVASHPKQVYARAMPQCEQMDGLCAVAHSLSDNRLTLRRSMRCWSGILGRGTPRQRKNV
jgi:hypothetical protein